MAAPASVRNQYESWPYPVVPLWASLDRAQLWQLNAAWIADRCGRGPLPERPRIWIAGCGTFQPYVIARANPAAEIVATDLSEASLRLARRRCRVHGIKNVEFAHVDLDDPSSWPEGEFDLIESYGVLMNLPRPGATLAQLGRRLTPDGIVRLMVYPHFGRQRIFQLQRVARLLGLTATERDHPSRLRRAVGRLPLRHPLRYAFDSYADSRHDAGIVDAFLHAGDRGFSAFELMDLARSADLQPAFWFQREWGQPSLAAENLGFPEWSQAATLHYLDLWQELRSNFVVCLTRAEHETRTLEGEALVPHARPALRVHPLFDPAKPDLGARHRLRLLGARLFGAKLPSKVSPPVQLSAADARLLQAGTDALHHADPRQIARLVSEGLLLGHEPWRNDQAITQEVAAESEFRSPRFEIHRRARNPLFDHLFKAWTADRCLPELGLPDLEGQMGRWLPHADPLEAHHRAFGLTPYRTFQLLRTNVHDYLADWHERPTVAGWEDVRLRQETRCFEQVRVWAGAAGIDRPTQDPAGLRELWVMLFAYDTLFLPFEG